MLTRESLEKKARNVIGIHARECATFALEAAIEAVDSVTDHNDTYEGSCGVHMASHCDKCVTLARLRAELAKDRTR